MHSYQYLYITMTREEKMPSQYLHRKSSQILQDRKEITDFTKSYTNFEQYGKQKMRANLTHCLKISISTRLYGSVQSLSHVQLFETPWTATHQAPPSMGFSRQEYWSGVPSPSPSSVVQFANSGDAGSIPELGRFPGEEMATYSSILDLENSMDRGAWQAAVHGVTKCRTRLSDFTSSLLLHRDFYQTVVVLTFGFHQSLEY